MFLIMNVYALVFVAAAVVVVTTHLILRRRRAAKAQRMLRCLNTAMQRETPVVVSDQSEVIAA